MTQIFCSTDFNKVDHSTFGGLIYPSDFNTEHKGKGHRNGSAIAERIIRDQAFDNQCRNNLINRQNCRESENSKKQ